jgi:hypothetical protein
MINFRLVGLAMLVLVWTAQARGQFAHTEHEQIVDAGVKPLLVRATNLELVGARTNRDLARQSRDRLLVVICEYQTNCPQLDISSQTKCATHLSVKTALHQDQERGL